MFRSKIHDWVYPSEIGKIEEENWAKQIKAKHTINPRKLEIDFDAENRGLIDGAKNHPLPDAHREHDEFHNQIIHEFTLIFRRQASQLGSTISDVSRRINGFDFSNFSHIVEEAYQKLKTERLPSLRHDSMETCKDAVHNYKVCLDAHAKFKHDNGRVFEAKPPGEWLTTFLIIGAMMVLESVLNSHFLKDFTEGGAKFGLKIAIVITVVNVISSLVVGYTFGKGTLDQRRTASGQMGKTLYSILSMVMITVWLAGIFVWNGIISNGRYLAQQAWLAKVDDPMSEALNQTIPTFFAGEWPWLNDMSTLAMFLTGVVFASVAFFKGLYIGDIYPGYWKSRKNIITALANLNDAKHAFSQQVDAEQIDTLQTLKTTGSQIEKAFFQINKSVDRYYFLIQHFRSEEQRVNSVLRLVAEKYRNANVSTRGSSPPPRYFDEEISIERKDLNKFEFARFDDFQDKISDERTELREKITDRVSHISKLCVNTKAQFVKDVESYRSLVCFPSRQQEDLRQPEQSVKPEQGPRPEQSRVPQKPNVPQVFGPKVQPARSPAGPALPAPTISNSSRPAG